jgi:hypothetical protein
MKFRYPQPKEASLGESTELLKQTRAAAPSDSSQNQNGSRRANFPKFLSSMKENFSNKLDAAKEKNSDGGTQNKGTKESRVLKECRDAIKTLRRKTTVSPYENEWAMMDAIQGRESEEPALSFQLDVPLDLSSIGKGRKKPPLESHVISPSYEDGHKTTVFTAQQLQTNPLVSSPLVAVEGRHQFSEECSPLQGILLQTIEGREVTCNTSKNNGIFQASVASNVNLLQIKLMFHSMFKQDITVHVDGIVISTHSQSVLELQEGQSEFCLEIDYPENDNTIVSDQYLLLVQRGSSSSPSPQPDLAMQQQDSRMSLACGTGGEEKSKLDHDIENIKTLESQLEKLEEHFALNLNMLNSSISQKPGGPAKAAAALDDPDAGNNAGSLSLQKEVKRQITPDSPLVFSGFLAQDDESVFSSHGSACGGSSTTSTPLSSRRKTKRDGVSHTETHGRSNESNENNIRSSVTEKGKIGSKERLAIASERILRLEAQFNQQTSEVHKGMKTFQEEFMLESDRTRKEVIHRQNKFESSTTKKMSEMQQNIDNFAHSLFGKISEEKSLIQVKSKEIEQRLNQKVGKLLNMLEAVQEATVASSSPNSDREEINRLRQSQKRLHDKVSSMETKTNDFRASVLADISALEELMHTEKKERQREDESIMKALNMYTETISESLRPASR